MDLHGLFSLLSFALEGTVSGRVSAQRLGGGAFLCVKSANSCMHDYTENTINIWFV